MTRTSPILYWVLGLLVLCAGFGFWNGFSTATHRDTPSWAGGSSFSGRPDQAAAPGIEPPEAQPLAADNPTGVVPIQTAPAEKPKPKDEDADKPEGDDTTASPVGQPAPVALPAPTGGDKPAATADKPKPGATSKPKPAPTAPAAEPAATPDTPPPAQQPAVPY